MIFVSNGIEIGSIIGMIEPNNYLSLKLFSRLN